MKISICIPCYEMGGHGSDLLKRSFDYINNQTHKNIEVVISDHSIDDKIENLCDQYSSSFDIKYLRNSRNRGNFSSNLNNSIRNASGQVLKLLMQDDYLMDSRSIELVSQAFQDPSVKWSACGCYSGWNESDYNKMIPKYDDSSLLRGVNTIGSPSVITIRNQDVQYFDEKLTWIVDLDYYKRMNTVFGTPFIIPEYSVFVQRHPNQITNILPDHIKSIEEIELKNRYA